MRACLGAVLAFGLLLGAAVVLVVSDGTPRVRWTSAPDFARGATTQRAPRSPWRVRRESLVEDPRPLLLTSNLPGQRMATEELGSLVNGYGVDRLRTRTHRTSLPGALMDGPVPFRRDGIAVLVLIGAGHHHYRLSVLLGSSDGRLSRQMPLAAADDVEAGQLAVNARGDLAVTWLECRRREVCHGDFVSRVAVLPAGAPAFGRPAALRSGVDAGGFDASYTTTMALDPRGNLALTESDLERLSVRVWPAGGRLGPARTVDRHLGPLDPHLVIAGPRLVVAWTVGDRGTSSVRVVTGPLADRPLGPTQVLDPGDPHRTSHDSFGLQLVTAGAHATVAWARPGGMRTSDAPPGDRFGPAQLLAGDAPMLQSLVGRPGGALVLTAQDGAGDRVTVRRRAPGARRFGPAEPIPGAHDVYSVLTEVDPRTGRPIVTIQRNAPGPRVAQEVLTATRP